MQRITVLIEIHALRDVRSSEAHLAEDAHESDSAYAIAREMQAWTTLGKPTIFQGVASAQSLASSVVSDV